MLITLMEAQLDGSNVQTRVLKPTGVLMFWLDLEQHITGSMYKHASTNIQFKSDADHLVTLLSHQCHCHY